jgi:hypothetical protein
MTQHPNVSFGALLYTTLMLSGFVEFRRLQDIRNPGSQADNPWPEWQGFFNIGGFKGEGNGYPGGPHDPFGFAAGNPAVLAKYKVNEIKNGRLAMVAFVGFAAQVRVAAAARCCGGGGRSGAAVVHVGLGLTAACLPARSTPPPAPAPSTTLRPTWQTRTTPTSLTTA